MPFLDRGHYFPAENRLRVYEIVVDGKRTGHTVYAVDEDHALKLAIDEINANDDIEGGDEVTVEFVGDE